MLGSLPPVRRVAAVLGAVVMIVAALGVRSLIDGDDGGSGSGGGGSGPVRLVCVSEVRAACEVLADEDDDVEVTVAAAGTTIAELTAPDFRGDQSPYDGWVTLEPLPAVADARSGDGVLEEPSAPLAASDVVVVAGNDRAEALLATCGDPSVPEDDPVLETTCVAEAAGTAWSDLGGSSSWGSLRLGFDDPSRTAAGQVVLGQLTTAYFAAADPPLSADQYASNDFSSDFRSYLVDVGGGSDTSATGGSPLDRLVQRGPATFGAVLTLEATAQGAIEGTRAEDDLTVLYPAPMATAVVTMAPVGGAPGAEDVLDDDLLDALEAALADTGWSTDDPTQVGLPRGGVADALERLWNQVS